MVVLHSRWRTNGAPESRFPPGLIESVELAELIQLRARRAEVVGLVLPIAVADRHAAEQHLVLRRFQEIADGIVEPRPGLLRTGVEPIAAGGDRHASGRAAQTPNH